MKTDPSGPAGISPNVAPRAMKQRADDQRSFAGMISRRITRATTTAGRQGQSTAIHSHRMRDATSAWDNLTNGAGRNSRTVDIGNAKVYSRGFCRSDCGEPTVTHANPRNPHGEVCAGPPFVMWVFAYAVLAST